MTNSRMTDLQYVVTDSLCKLGQKYVLYTTLKLLPLFCIHRYVATPIIFNLWKLTA